MHPTDYLIANWQVPNNIHAITTYRTGGNSQSVYSSFNLASHVGDNSDTVLQNRQQLMQLLNLPNAPIWLNQTHSNTAVRAQTSAQPINADASYSNQAGVVCAVLTADCLPVALCSTDGQQIAAIHAGWRGLADGIISNTVAALRVDNPKAEFIAWLGPAIGTKQFEVGAEVREVFVAQSQDNALAFKARENKWLADIYQLARRELNALGIHAVYGGGLCTVSDSEHFYSYRRDKQTGRMATLIWRS
ncbi:MAG: peptidoglycan editing factor PgeF [Methylococcaceae bacterium]